MSKKNPLNFVTFYKNDNIVTNDKLRALMPSKFEETIVRIYTKDIDNFDTINDIISECL